MNIFKLDKNNTILFAILVAGFALRLYRVEEMMGFGQDSDLQGWIVKDLLVNKHLRLIGQETSMQGIFIGPLYYYLIAPFYLLFKMDPYGAAFFAATLGLIKIWSVFFVFGKIFDKRVGLIAAFLYATSFFAVSNDKTMIPTSPIIVWSVWFYYSIHLLLKGEQKKGLILAGILTGLIWHVSVSLYIMLPAVLVALYLAKKKLDLRATLYGIAALIISSLPLFAFEFRNNLPQAKSLINAFVSPPSVSASFLERLQKVVDITLENISGLVWQPVSGYQLAVPALLAIVFVFLVRKKLLPKNQAMIFAFWQAIFVVFFSLYTVPVAEYYLNGTMVVWIAVLALVLNFALKNKFLKKFGIVAIILITAVNLWRLKSMKSGGFGYVERSAVVQFIKADAKKSNYPCVAVSHMAAPGYELGYRYLFWLEDMHVNRPESGSPVYTVVYPLNRAGRFDAVFGAIGVVGPDYERYDTEGIRVSCSGENTNLTDPMFLYSE